MLAVCGSWSIQPCKNRDKQEGRKELAIALVTIARCDGAKLAFGHQTLPNKEEMRRFSHLWLPLRARRCQSLHHPGPSILTSIPSSLCVSLLAVWSFPAVWKIWGIISRAFHIGGSRRFIPVVPPRVYQVYPPPSPLPFCTVPAYYTVCSGTSAACRASSAVSFCPLHLLLLPAAALTTSQ